MPCSCVSCQSPVKPVFSWKDAFFLKLFSPSVLLPLEQWFCEECRQKMTWINEECQRCSKSLEKEKASFIYHRNGLRICYDCVRWSYWEEERAMESLLTRNWSAQLYNEWLKEIIETYKFRRDERLKYPLASFLLSLWETKVREELQKQEIHIDYILPIPLSTDRLEERGFNQAEQIATLFAKQVRFPCIEDFLIRIHDNEKQSKKARDERLVELFHKFIKNPQHPVDIRNKNIILIDDIYTTGATLHAAAYTLKQSGANEIFSLTIAR
ncbi:ComF family protein [Caldalkalibacillus mannanilyticus]|uniref:ComF family protein n=1 Tax=Caldalkalibacillus mannanilyticus TaxID=1418 RepID=UPI00046B082A|nr:ComF family protein [Caldalkalibacillus mannanilyticus]